MLLKNSVLRLAVGAMTVAIALALASPAGAAPEDTKPPESTVGVTVAARPADADAIVGAASTVSPALARSSATVQARIISYVRTHGTSHTFGAYADPATGRIVIETNAPADVVASLTRNAGAPITVRRATITDSFSRKDDIAPFWGGGGIVLSTGVARCSSGYAVKNAAGIRFQVTAGHCFKNGQTARTELGGRIVGTVRGNGLPSKDMELLGGQSYGTYIFIGGTNDARSAHIASAADPVVGYANYCHSGRTTGQHCGHKVTSVTATVCTTSGCKSPVIAFTGGVLPSGGDSGSPFYANSVDVPDKHIRGHIIAVGGNAAYAEKWSRVAAAYGVSIVT